MSEDRAEERGEVVRQCPLAVEVLAKADVDLHRGGRAHHCCAGAALAGEVLLHTPVAGLAEHAMTPRAGVEARGDAPQPCGAQTRHDLGGVMSGAFHGTRTVERGKRADLELTTGLEGHLALARERTRHQERGAYQLGIADSSAVSGDEPLEFETDPRRSGPEARLADHGTCVVDGHGTSRG